MTEQEWLTSIDSLALYASIFRDASERKLRLAAVACCQRVLPLLIDERSRVGLTVFEEHADNEASWQSFHRARFNAEKALREMQHRWPHDSQTQEQKRCVDAAIVIHCLLQQELLPDRTRSAVESTWLHGAVKLSGAALSATQSALVRDIFGNPFRPVAFAPEWRTDTAVALARTMYDQREFGAMPILADALQDAGCDHPDILAHCRDTSLTHVRGCWVADLVLGKE